MENSENTQAQYSNESSANNPTPGIRFLILLLKHKWFILIFVVFCTALSVVVSLQLQNKYLATVNVVPPSSSQSLIESAIGSISTEFKDFGLPQLGGESQTGYDLMAVFESRTVADSMINYFNLVKRYEVDDSLVYKTRKIFEDNLDIELNESGNYTVSIWDRSPDTAAIMANKFIEFVNEKLIKMQNREAKINRRHIEQRLAKTDSTLKTVSEELAEFSREKMVLFPESQAQSISTALAELKSRVYKGEVNYEILKNTYGENDPITKMQQTMINEMEKKLEDMKSQPGFAGNFSLKEATGVGIKYLSLYTEFETFSRLKAFLLPMLEKARIDENLKEQSLIILDEAVSPEKKDKPRRSVIVAGTFAGSLSGAILFIFLLYGYRNLQDTIKKAKS